MTFKTMLLLPPYRPCPLTLNPVVESTNVDIDELERIGLAPTTVPIGVVDDNCPGYVALAISEKPW